MTSEELIKQIKEAKENIILIYAFNSTGKTRLSVGYKDYTKSLSGGNHVGVYYNAFSEDLFVWDNDEPNDNENIRLTIGESSLDQFIKKLNDEAPIREKLLPYKPKYDFKLIPKKDDNPELGWGSVKFFLGDDPEKQIKISRGEERIFVWCFFLALFEIEGWADKQNKHFFIDDPISSLDDNNIFVTARLLLQLFEKNCDSKKIIVTTHHMGLFSLLHNWLKSSENESKFKIKKIVTTETKKNVAGKDVIGIKEKEQIENKFLVRFLEKENNDYKLIGLKRGNALYHLLILKVLKRAVEKNELYTYHFVLLRQVMESISSFLGKGRFSYILDVLEIDDPNYKSDIINSLSHENIYIEKSSNMNPENKDLFIKIHKDLMDYFKFSI